MPLYDYRCQDCGQEFEKMVRFSEANLAPCCPQCASLNTRKKLASVVVLGGSASGATRSSASTSSCGSSSGFR